MALGAAIYFWCAWDFATAGQGTPAPIDPPKHLVVRGLYRFVRNPMYAGVLLLLAGESLAFQSLRILAYAAIVFAVVNLFVIFYEEPALKRIRRGVRGVFEEGAPVDSGRAMASSGTMRHNGVEC